MRSFPLQFFALTVAACSAPPPVKVPPSVPEAAPKIPPSARPRPWSGYVSKRAVTSVYTTPPRIVVEKHCVPMTPAEREIVRKRDGACLTSPLYQIFQSPNEGPTRIAWTGRAGGNHQVFLSYWNGERLVVRSVPGVRETATHVLTVDLPPAVELISVMVNCTQGEIVTDAVAWGPFDGTLAFASVPEAVGFIAGCLVADDRDRLVRHCVGGRKPEPCLAQHPAVFDMLKALHRASPLEQLYTDRAFPKDAPDGTPFKLGGHGKRYHHLHVDFVRRGGVWHLTDIWNCR